MKLSELIPFLQELDARPKKSLSQNFLIDLNIIRKIVEIADVKPGDRVLEIGPGPGALTAALLDAGARVLAVEKDSKFAEKLHRLQTPDQRLEVTEADFLEFPLEDLPFPLKVVANLPYHITTPILERLCNRSSDFTSVTVMVQKEVASRMAASCGSKEFSSLSLFLQFYGKLSRPFKVPAHCFYPKPKVDSAVIRLDFQPPPPIDAALFHSVVRKAFQQRRKMLSTSLKSLLTSEEIKKLLVSIGADGNARPESLSLETWLEFYRVLPNNLSNLSLSTKSSVPLTSV